MRRLLMSGLLAALACSPAREPQIDCDGDCLPEAGSDDPRHRGHDAGSKDATEPSDSCLQRLGTLEGETKLTTSADWAPDDDYALAGALDEMRLLRIDTATGAIDKLATYRGQKKRPAAWWSPDGKVALSAADDLRLLTILREPPAIKEVARLAVGSEGLFHVAWSASGRHALVTGRDVRLIQVNTQQPALKELAKFEGHEGRVFMSVWSPDGRHALSAGADKTVRLLAVDLKKGSLREVGSYLAKDMVTVVAWHPSANLAMAGTWLGENGLTLLSVDTLRGQLTEQKAFAHAENNLRAIKWTPDGSRAVWSGHNGSPRICTLASDGMSIAPQASLPSDGSGVHELSWSPNGQFFIVAASQHDRVTLVDARACLLPFDVP